MLDNAKNSLMELIKKGELRIGDEIPFQLTEETEYVSYEEKNGFEDQTISTKQIKDTTLIFLGVENGKVKTVLSKPFGNLIFRGLTGKIHYSKELNNIAEKLLGNQKGVALARTINRNDVFMDQSTWENVWLNRTEFVWMDESSEKEWDDYVCKFYLTALCRGIPCLYPIYQSDGTTYTHSHSMCFILYLEV